MIPIPRAVPDSASPRMMALSVALHTIAILALIVFAYSAPRYQIPGQSGVSRVRIVENFSAPKHVEKLRQSTSIREEIPAPLENIRIAPENSRQTVDFRNLTESEKSSIRLTKRKKPPRRVDLPKTAEKKPEQATQKKEDPQSFLDKRLASIRREVESKKTDNQTHTIASGETGSKLGILSDADLLRWLDLVKNRINSNWSVFFENRSINRITVIGVRLDEKGRISDVAIDESSGDEMFDKWALRAVLQATPFPPLSHENRDKVLKAGGLALRFTPRGLQ